MQQARRRTIRWVAVLIFGSYGLIAVTALYAADQIEEEAQARAAQVTTETCQSRNQIKHALREVITLATSSGGGVSMSSLPSFADLDPETQDFVLELEAVSSESSGAGDALQGYAERFLQDEDCAALAAAVGEG